MRKQPPVRIKTEDSMCFPQAGVETQLWLPPLAAFAISFFTSMNALHQHGSRQKVRLSCCNPDIKIVYDEFLGKPLGEKAKELLHIKRA